MKNINLIPTKKPSRLAYYQESTSYSKPILQLVSTTSSDYTYQHIYITNDEEIKEGNYYITPNDTVLKALGSMLINVEYYKKIILTTDQDLIKDGVQAIEDEFLQWFCKNPSCEEFTYEEYMSGKYLIPKEEPKQETLEEVLRKIKSIKLCLMAHPNNEIDSEFADRITDLEEIQIELSKDKWQQQRSYSDEEVIKLLQKALIHQDDGETGSLVTAQGEIRPANFYSWFEQFKKK